MNKHKQIFLAAFFALTLLGCSAHQEIGSTDQNGAVEQKTLASAEQSGGEGPIGGVGIDGIEELWLSAGADAGLASCYTEVLVSSADVRTITDLNDLQNAMASLDSDAQLSINACLTSDHS